MIHICVVDYDLDLNIFIYSFINAVTYPAFEKPMKSEYDV